MSVDPVSIHGCPVKRIEDVYKRQGQEDGEPDVRLMRLTPVSAPFGTAAFRSSYVVTVSYTHLQFRVQVKQEILQKLDCGLDFSDGQVRRLIDERLCRSDCIGRLDVAERRKLGRELFAAIRGFDVLQELLEDKRITEIMVNGPDRIFIEKDGRLTQWQGRFESPARLLLTRCWDIVVAVWVTLIRKSQPCRPVLSWEQLSN